MPHKVASDLGQHYLVTGFSIKNRIKVANRPDTSKMTNGLVQHIIVEKSTCIQWVKGNNLLTVEQIFSFKTDQISDKLKENH